MPFFRGETGFFYERKQRKEGKDKTKTKKNKRKIRRV